MTEKSIPSASYLRKRLRYDQETGKLFWLPYVGMHRRWLSRYAGKEAFTARRSGYHVGRVDDVCYAAHRVIWVLVHGVWPPADIDHVNGVRDDNRLVNLRAVSRQENCMNVGKRASRSGVSGVHLHKYSGLWHGCLQVAGRKFSVGYFKNLDDAAAAVAEARRRLGFTARHGV